MSMNEYGSAISPLAAKVMKLNSEIARLKEVIASLHYHHKMFEPDCKHCQASLERINGPLIHEDSSE